MLCTYVLTMIYIDIVLILFSYCAGRDAEGGVNWNGQHFERVVCRDGGGGGRMKGEGGGGRGEGYMVRTNETRA